MQNRRYTRKKITYFHCASAELFFSYCDSVAAAATTWTPRSSTCENCAAGISLGTAAKYPRRTTGAAAGCGLGTTSN
jgi:hypothetical protein